MRKLFRKRQPAGHIGTQLLIDTVPVAGLLLVAGLILIWQVTRLSQAVESFHKADERAHIVTEVQEDNQRLINAISQSLMEEDAESFIRTVSTNLDTLRDSTAELNDLVNETPENSDGYPLLSQVNTKLETVVGIAETMIRQAEAEQWPSVSVRIGVLKRDQEQLDADIQSLVLQTEEIEQRTSEQVAAARRAAVVLPSVILIAVFMGGFIILRTARNFAEPIEQLTASVMEVAAGNLSRRVPDERQDELGSLARAFNQMADEVQTSQEELEQRVADRTRELEHRAVQLRAAAEVGRAVVSIRNLDELLQDVTRLVSESFGFYHTGIFLVDEAGEYAWLRAANSQGGRQMLSKQHRLKIGEVGIVGNVTSTGNPRIALDVGKDAYHFKNPYLPETRSEMALPMIAGGQMLGALDVQSTKPDAFSEEDIGVLQVVTDLVAVAIQNARLFAENEEALDAARRAYAQVSQKAWEELLAERPVSGFRFKAEQGLEVLQEGLDAPAEERTLTLPIQVRDLVIGEIRGSKKSGEREWTEEEISLFATLTKELSVALDNARLYMESQRKAERERLVAEITTKLRASNEPRRILETAVRELKGALRASGANFRVVRRSESTTNGSPADSDEPRNAP